MKEIFILGLLLFIASGIFAQSNAQEALEALDAVKNYIRQENYAKAQEELDFVQNKIGEMLAGNLLRFIPDNPQGFTFIKKKSSTLGSSGVIIGSANSGVATGYYRKGNASFEISISKGGLLGQSGSFVSGLATMFGGMGGGVRQHRINGYTGTLEYDEDALSGSLSICIAGRITVIITAEDLKNPDLLKSLAEQIDLAGLEKSE